MALRSSTRVGKKRKSFKRRSSRRRNVRRRLVFNTGLRRSILSYPLHSFRRYGLGKQFQTSMDANGDRTWSVQCNGIKEMVLFGGTVSMPSVSEFTNLFDEYRINYFVVEFIPRFDNADLANSNAVALPYIYWYFDMDDASVPGSSDEVMQYAHVRRARFNHPISIICKFPCIAQQVYNGVTPAYEQKRAPFLNMSQHDVPHYGIKGLIRGIPNQAMTFDVRVTWQFQCKGLR